MADKSKENLDKVKKYEKEADKYNASQIQVLGGLEAVRKRPGMYIGSTSSQGLHHLVWEIIDNSIDERLAGFATKIEVTINEDGSVTVQDDGRGMPVDIQEKTGRPALETVFTVLHAGGTGLIGVNSRNQDQAVGYLVVDFCKTVDIIADRILVICRAGTDDD